MEYVIQRSTAVCGSPTSSTMTSNGKEMGYWFVKLCLYFSYSQDQIDLQFFLAVYEIFIMLYIILDCKFFCHICLRNSPFSSRDDPNNKTMTIIFNQMLSQ